MAKCRRPEVNPATSLMWNVASSLARDFQDNLDDPSFCDDLALSFNKQDLRRARELSSAPIEEDDTARFKAAYQLQSLLKRYRFDTDIYSDSELAAQATEQFNKTQDRIRNHDYTLVSAFTKQVVEHARIYIAKTVGVYSDEEHRSLCRFGRRASVGIPSRVACEAARWELPISGSSEQISWFDSEMSQVCSVQDYWAKQMDSDPNRSIYQETSSLALTLVPKSYKSLRAIMPNTTIGSYMSFGLGEMLRKRLQRKGYDIKTLQERHKVLARTASHYSCYVTADLSSASDSISVALVEALFPPDWVKILTQSRIGTVTLPDGSRVESETFCTMGIGYTFPLQTLVFLSLLKAIEATLYGRWNRRTVSVYGDDMIYSTPMHSSVVQVFEELAFVFNKEKTFDSGYFRESCGGDYYRGVDVRPFQPRNGSASISPRTYEAMLYKCVNGLLMRWDEHEIGRTLRLLTSEIEKLVGKCKIVPGNYPDDSGIKCPTLHHWVFLQCAAKVTPKFIGHGIYRFPYLRFKPDLRKEVRHEPYLWMALRGLDSGTDDYNGPQQDYGSVPFESLYSRQTGSRDRFRLQVRLDEGLGLPARAALLLWREMQPVMSTRSKLTGRRLRRLESSVVISHSGRYTRQSGSSCFEDRR